MRRDRSSPNPRERSGLPAGKRHGPALWPTYGSCDAVEFRSYLSGAIALQCGVADNRTISQLEAEGYPWIGCECCKGTVWVPFKMLRERIPMLSAMTLDQLGAKMKCDRCGKRPERYYPANQSDTPGFVRS